MIQAPALGDASTLVGAHRVQSTGQQALSANRVQGARKFARAAGHHDTFVYLFAVFCAERHAADAQHLELGDVPP